MVENNNSREVLEVKVDVEVLKTQVSTITLLCSKMDTVIEKLINQHDKHIEKIYQNMDFRNSKIDDEIKATNNKIDSLAEKVQDSVQETETRLMNEIKGLRAEMQTHNTQESSSIEKIMQWKHMVIGAIFIFLILFTKIDPELVTKILSK